MNRPRIILPHVTRPPPTRADRVCGWIKTAGVLLILGPAMFVSWCWKQMKGQP